MAGGRINQVMVRARTALPGADLGGAGDDRAVVELDFERDP